MKIYIYIYISEIFFLTRITISINKNIEVNSTYLEVLTNANQVQDFSKLSSLVPKANLVPK